MSIFGVVSGNYTENPLEIDEDTDLTTKSLTTTNINTTDISAVNGNFTVLKIGENNVSTLIGEKHPNLDANTDLTVKNLTATSIKIGSSDVNTLINQKQNTITSTSNITCSSLNADTLKIANVSVSTMINGKQNTIVDGGLAISKISGLQTELNNKALSSTVTSLQTTVNGKQNTIVDGGLSISKISGLQTELNNKALSSTVTSLQTTVNEKQDKLTNLIDATVKKLTANNITLNGADLKTTLDTKISTIANGSISFDMVSGLSDTLEYKQARITGDSLIRIGGLAIGSTGTIPDNGYLSVKNGILVNGVDLLDVINANSNTQIEASTQYCFVASCVGSAAFKNYYHNQTIEFNTLLNISPENSTAFTPANYSYTTEVAGYYNIGYNLRIMSPGNTYAQFSICTVNDAGAIVLLLRGGDTLAGVSNVNTVMFLDAGVRLFIRITTDTSPSFGHSIATVSNESRFYAYLLRTEINSISNIIDSDGSILTTVQNLQTSTNSKQPLLNSSSIINISRLGLGVANPLAPVHINNAVAQHITQFAAHGGKLLTWSGVHHTSFESQQNDVSLWARTGIVANNIWVGFSIAFQSDLRIKKNITDLDDVEALNILRLIQPKKYKYIDPRRGENEVIGFIAQDVRDVLPHAHKYTVEVIPNIQQVGIIVGVPPVITVTEDITFEYDDNGLLFNTMSIYGEDFNDAVKIQFEIIDSKNIRVTGGETLPPLHIVDGVNYVEGYTWDIDKIFESNNFDIIYHFGEYSRIVHSFDDINFVSESILRGTPKVFEFAKKCNAKIIYSASSSKFGNNGKDENLSPYAWMKSKMVELLKNYNLWFGLQYEISYFFNVYGPKQIYEGNYATVVAIFERQFNNNEKLTVVKPGTSSL